METEQIKEHVMWAIDQQLGILRHEFKTDFFQLKEEFKVFMDLFEIPGLIGEKMPYANI